MHCHRCGRESPTGFRYCGYCGAQLAEPGAGEIEERKTVSALFCDLVGFTPRAEGLDPEDVHRLLRVYFDSVRGQFERFGGTIAKYIGDAVFVLFGAPRAHEDDPERAVRSALAALDAIAALNATDPSPDLHVRIGVTTGEVLVTLQREGLAWGDILNTASRIEAAAAPDSILVDDATYEATKHVIEYDAVAPVAAKGIIEPVVVWRPLAPRAHRGHDLPAGDAGRRPFVGRRAELELLLDAFESARVERAPQLITLVGEAGIGKSCLVVELFRQIDARPDLVTWRQGRSPPYPDGVSFWALGEIVKHQAGVLESDGAEVASGKLARAVADLVADPAEAARVEGHLGSLVGLGEPAEARGDLREAAFAAWRRFVEALAAQRPLVLVLEDVHWADDGLLDFVEHLAEWAQDSPLLIVCTARPELLARRSGWGALDRARSVVLSPLCDAETRELVTGPAGLPLAEEVTEAIVARAGGNPLYAVEFVRMLADRPPVATEEALPLPDSLRGIVASRVDSLSPDDKALLHAGSVIGRTVWPGALSAITGRPREWVEQRLGALEEREFLARRPRSSVEHEPEYRFQHVLIRDVAYGEIPRGRRGRIHLRTAEWLESLSPTRAADRAEMLAHHYLCAYEMALAAGDDAAALVDRARLALRDAGDRALALHAFPAAARFFGGALELWPADDSERPWLLFRLGRSRYSAETGGAAELAEARDALLAAGDPGTAAEAEAFLGFLAHHEGRRDLVAEHLERAVGLVEGLGPTRSKADVLVGMATHLSTATEHERTIVVASEALEIARALELDELQACALSLIGISRGLSGDPGGRADLERSIEIADRIGSPLSADCYGKLADLEGQTGDLGACFALQAQARREAERFGHAPFVRWLAAERVGEGYWTGAWDDAVARADRLIAEVEAGAPNFMEGYCRAMRGRIRLARGDVAGARSDAARALEFARAAEDLQMLYPALAFGARTQVDVGSRDEGAALADELLALWRERPGAYPASSWVVDLALALNVLGRGPELAAAAAAARVGTRWLDAVVAFAADDFSEAADRFAAIGSQPDEALARLRAAEALMAAGRRAEAHAELDRAVAFHRLVDASAYVDEAAALAGAFVSAPRPP
jgi:class 3 adenylate cyclase/tetratricopeptide (TPR) repeat protein